MGVHKRYCSSGARVRRSRRWSASYTAVDETTRSESRGCGHRKKHSFTTVNRAAAM
jgi:hypothetical protein